MCVIGDVIGLGVMVTAFTTFAEQPPAVIVSVTLTDPAPGVVQVTVIEFVPWPAAIVPPVTTQLYVCAAILGVLYVAVLPFILSHTGVGPVITGVGKGFTVTTTGLISTHPATEVPLI